MKLRFLFLPMTLILSQPYSCYAGNIITPTVQGLYEACKEKPGSLKWAMCMQYISGVADTMLTNAYLLDDPNYAGLDSKTKDAIRVIAVCGTFTTGASGQAFINWAEKNPEQWQELQVGGVMKALRETWPCK